MDYPRSPKYRDNFDALSEVLSYGEQQPSALGSPRHLARAAPGSSEPSVSFDVQEGELWLLESTLPHGLNLARRPRC